ncbi:MAG: hypothetical protein NT062_00560 [Proteobacteria bacterium]|nr:hypothetical protein [Pseudomonadota bacterium]
MVLTNLVWLLVVGGGVGGAIWYVLTKERRAAAKVPRFTVADLPPVTVGRLVGIARAVTGTVPAPLSTRPCLFYRVRVTSDSGKVEVADGTGGVTFELDDGTGVATVEIDGATAVLASRKLGRDERPGAAAYLTRLQSQDQRTILSFYEGLVADGARIAVVGFGNRDATGRLVMSSSPHLPLAIVDLR